MTIRRVEDTEPFSLQLVESWNQTERGMHITKDLTFATTQRVEDNDRFSFRGETYYVANVSYTSGIVLGASVVAIQASWVANHTE